jgi:GT2 family glycosyltransferase
VAPVLLSVVVVNWNAKDDTLACLASLERQTHRELEVVVVDNASEDGSVDAIRARFPGAKVLAEPTNWGFAEGCNRGIAVTTGPWIALLNNDAEADERWAEELVRAARSADARCGMLQSLMVFADRPGVINSTGIELTASGGGRDRLEHRTRDAAGEAPREIFCPTGGACAYRREMLDAVRLPDGFFDPTHFCYYEDMDLGWRARLAGWSAWLVPTSAVRHRWHGSTARRGRAWLVRLATLNRVRTLVKNASVPFLARTTPQSAADVAKMLWWTRGRGLGDLAAAVGASVVARRRVSHLRTVDRRALERAWVQPDEPG